MSGPVAHAMSTPKEKTEEYHESGVRSVCRHVLSASPVS